MAWIFAAVLLAITAVKVITALLSNRGGSNPNKGDGEAGVPAIPVGPRPSRSASAVLDPPTTHD